MAKASMRFETVAKGKPEEVFTYVANLPEHGEWSANPLEIKPINDVGGVGQRYQSHATVGNLAFDTELEVTVYDAPRQFGFKGEDATGRFAHLFTFTSENEGTRVVREINFDLPFGKWVMFHLLYFPVRRPAGRTAMERLRQKFA